MASYADVDWLRDVRGWGNGRTGMDGWMEGMVLGAGADVRDVRGNLWRAARSSRMEITEVDSLRIHSSDDYFASNGSISSVCFFHCCQTDSMTAKNLVGVFMTTNGDQEAPGSGGAYRL